MKRKRILKCVLLAILTVLLIAGGGACWLFFGSHTTNPHNYSKVGDIPAPYGYQRISGDNAAYSNYLRSIPLKGKGAESMLYTGEKTKFQKLSYAIIDLPLLSNAEQCADACMRMRAEYLFQAGRYGDIHFKDVNGHVMRYTGGSSRKSFERYLRRVYGLASTFSLSRELPRRELKDMQPGDIFVYAAIDRPDNRPSGHAVMVVDVAQNPKTGRKAFLLAEGNTPARDFHIMNNLGSPFRSPWFTLDEGNDDLGVSLFMFKKDELRHF